MLAQQFGTGSSGKRPVAGRNRAAMVRSAWQLRSLEEGNHTASLGELEDIHSAEHNPELPINVSAKKTLQHLSNCPTKPKIPNLTLVPQKPTFALH